MHIGKGEHPLAKPCISVSLSRWTNKHASRLKLSSGICLGAGDGLNGLFLSLPFLSFKDALSHPFQMPYSSGWLELTCGLENLRLFFPKVRLFCGEAVKQKRNKNPKTLCSCHGRSLPQCLRTPLGSRALMHLLYW